MTACFEAKSEERHAFVGFAAYWSSRDGPFCTSSAEIALRAWNFWEQCSMSHCMDTGCLHSRSVVLGVFLHDGTRLSKGDGSGTLY